MCSGRLAAPTEGSGGLKVDECAERLVAELPSDSAVVYVAQATLCRRAYS
jgi:hypothetical protein